MSLAETQGSQGTAACKPVNPAIRIYWAKDCQLVIFKGFIHVILRNIFMGESMVRFRRIRIIVLVVTTFLLPSSVFPEETAAGTRIGPHVVIDGRITIGEQHWFLSAWLMTLFGIKSDKSCIALPAS